MVSRTSAQRKAAQRARQEAQGLSKLEVWAPKHLHEQIKKYVERLRKRRSDQLSGGS